MATRLPRVLTRRYAETAAERQKLQERLGQVEAELSALSLAIRLVAPDWKPPKAVLRPRRPSVLPRGAVSEACLQILRQRQELSTPELAELVAARHRLTFKTREAKDDFGCCVLTALRRYEKQGLLEGLGKRGSTKALSWRIRVGANGRMKPLERAA
jgi:hypothetical protein